MTGIKFLSLYLLHYKLNNDIKILIYKLVKLDDNISDISWLIFC